jgi:hypothetical protein
MSGYFCTPKLKRTDGLGFKMPTGFDFQGKKKFFLISYAEVAQLVERNLAKVEVAGSNLVFRSKLPTCSGFFLGFPLVVELVDTQDLKSCSQQCECGFKSRLGDLEAALGRFFG